MLKIIALIIIALSGPVMLFTYGWGMVLIYEKAGPWVFAISCVSHIIAWIGISFLFDSRQLPPQTLGRD